MKKGRNRAYSNREIVVLWQAAKCVHATTCFTRLRTVFDPVKRPWINPYGASTERILEMIEVCPSEALTFRWVDESKNETETSPKLFRGSLDEVFGIASPADVRATPTPQNDNPTPQDDTLQEPAATITLRPNGPIVVGGNFELVGLDDGQRWSMVSLCRCGQSGNFPHCDGTHFKEGFRTE